MLTGAHVVANATFLQVQKVSDPNKFVARVEAICHDADLALLAIEDRELHAGRSTPDRLGTRLPRLRDRVSVVGYPIGGEEISITEGVVSRIEVQRYSHSERMLLAVTVDAAINDGNSGGPVYKKWQGGRHRLPVAQETPRTSGRWSPPPVIKPSSSDGAKNGAKRGPSKRARAAHSRARCSHPEPREPAAAASRVGS